MHGMVQSLAILSDLCDIGDAVYNANSSASVELGFDELQYFPQSTVTKNLEYNNAIKLSIRTL